MKHYYIDSHFHTNLKPLLPQADTILNEMKESHTIGTVVGTHLETSKIVIDQLARHDWLLGTIGLHPAYVSQMNESEIEDTLEYLTNFDYKNNPQICGIGECGFDYYRDVDTKEIRAKQEQVFLKQIAIAKREGLPLMIHVRNSKDTENACEHLLEIMKRDQNYTKVHFHLHFYGASVAMTEKFMSLGSTFGFDGPISFTDEYNDIIELIPAGKVLLETDAPYAAPVPMRGKTNMPEYVKYVYHAYAEKKGLTTLGTQEIMMENYKRIFAKNLKI